MIKVAGKPSLDPVQEKLRQSKKLWNKEVSSFIDDVIHFKKMVNGQPSKFFKEKSTIKEPIPADPVTIIGVLSNDFNDLAQKASAIAQQQASYSKTRRKKQPKQVINPSAQSTAPVTNTTDLSKQLSAAAGEFELLVLASNPVSRFFARILNPAIGKSPAARIRKYRMSLLNSSADIYKNLKKLQADVVGSSPESIFVTSKVFSRVEENWNFLLKGFETFKESMPDSTLGGIIPNPNKPAGNKDQSNEIDVIIEDYRKYISNFMDVDNKPLHKLIFKLISDEKEPNYNDTSEEVIQLKKRIIEEYKKIIAELNNKYSITGRSLKEIFELKVANDKKATAQIEKVAQDFLKKWYGKIRHQFSPLDKTSALRLDIFNLVEELMSLMDKIMDSLEKEMSMSTLEPLIKITNEKMLLTRRMINALEATLRGQDFDKSFMKMLEKGDVTEYGRSLSDKEKQKLETALERKRMTDLSKLYFNSTR